MSVTPVRVGVVGCGNISGIYLKNAALFQATEVVACADIIPERAAAKAGEFGIPRACSVEALLADPQVEVVLNLTPPRAHADIALAALEHGKSVYNEKPLAVRLEEGRRLVQLARSRGLRVGCAPDTFLGGAWQTARKLLDAGTIGEPVAAVAFMTCHGHEGWHPDPEFFYQVGGGPLFDMGPYYLTALVHLLGPVRRVTGSARITFPQRTITSAPRCGKKIDVQIPTHVAGVLDFACGAVGTIITSFDVWHANLPFVEIYGATGSLSLPDPNDFGGAVRVRGPADVGWRDVELCFGYIQNSRGLGVADMAHALRTGRPHRASGELALHVLEIMQALYEASDTGRHVQLGLPCARPAPLPPNLPPGVLDD